jgi:hypothetical protein
LGFGYQESRNRKCALRDCIITLVILWFLTDAFCSYGLQRHFPCRMCVSEEYLTDLVQFQACELSGMERQKPCVWEMGSGSHFMNIASYFSKPLRRGPVICSIQCDPGGTEQDAFLLNQLNV